MWQIHHAILQSPKHLQIQATAHKSRAHFLYFLFISHQTQGCTVLLQQCRHRLVLLVLQCHAVSQGPFKRHLAAALAPAARRRASAFVSHYPKALCMELQRMYNAEAV